jgi:hypothetical protein
LFFVLSEDSLIWPLVTLVESGGDDEATLLSLLLVDCRRVPLDVGGDLENRLVGIPVLRWATWAVTTLLFLSFDDLGVDLEAGMVVVVKPLLESVFGVGFTGKRAVGQPTDRVFEVFLVGIELVVDPSFGPAIEWGRVNDETPEVVLVVVERFGEALDPIGGCVILVTGFAEDANVRPVVLFPRAVDERIDRAVGPGNAGDEVDAVIVCLVNRVFSECCAVGDIDRWLVEIKPLVKMTD